MWHWRQSSLNVFGSVSLSTLTPFHQAHQHQAL
jgi:hypothetical protein